MNYAAFQAAAAEYRARCRAGTVHWDNSVHGEVQEHAHAQLMAAIAAEDWEAARAWLRPGVAHRASTYNHCERNYPRELGDAVRGGRADAIRESLWCRFQRDLPLIYRPGNDRPFTEHMIGFVTYTLHEIVRVFPLARTDLSDDLFGDGTVLDVWMETIHPLKPDTLVFNDYEKALFRHAQAATGSAATQM